MGPCLNHAGIWSAVSLPIDNNSASGLTHAKEDSKFGLVEMAGIRYEGLVVTIAFHHGWTLAHGGTNTPRIVTSSMLGTQHRKSFPDW